MNKDKLICPRCGSTDVEDINGTCVCFACRAKFPLPRAPRSGHAMRLFISYGHPEAPICQRIMDALRARGHQVWFDQTSMVHGEDWREQIADGIRRSDGVISCLSTHSVRDPGVSLDELSIAIGVRGGNIKTILLEPEKTVRPPASVCHIQWLDMSQWRAYMDRGEDVFRPWFNGKMQELFQVVESEDSRQFAGQISAIRKRLHVNYDTSKQQDLLRKGVVGREWLTAEVEAWLDDPAGARLCVLYGEPGVGKSAFAAKYIHYNPRVAAGLFCEYDRPIYNDARTVTMTLAYLLACRLPDYRMALADILEQEKRLGELGPAELFDRLLATPLTSLVIGGGHETLCIVIDGLDECAQGERNALAEVLAQYAPRLPAWLRILALARDVSSVTGPLEGAYCIRLLGSQAQNRQDVRAYLAGQLQDKYGGEPDWDAVLDALAERSGGIFLYAALAADALRAGRASLHDADAFPAGLGGMFQRWFGWFFPDQEEYEKRFRLPLGMLLAAPAPLPTQELCRIFDWDENALESFLRRVRVLLRTGTDDFDMQTVAFSHQYLSQWLDTLEAGRFRSSRTAAVSVMADRFYQLFRADPKLLFPYEAIHMLSLLAEAGQTARHDQMSADKWLFFALFRARNESFFHERLATALRCARQSEAVAERAAARQPEDQNLLSMAWSGEASVLLAYGQLDQALDLYSRASSLARRLEKQNGKPHSTQYDDDVARTLGKMGRHEEALAIFRQTLEHKRRLLREKDTPSNRASLCSACTQTAGMLMRTGRPDEALQLYDLAIENARQLYHTNKDDLNFRTHLFHAYSGKGRALLDLKQPDKALPLLQQAAAIAQIQAQQVNVPFTRRDLSNTYGHLGLALQRTGRPDQALAFYQKALSIRQALVRQFNAPEDQRYLLYLKKKVAELGGE